jgi:hypothetical protein
MRSLTQFVFHNFIRKHTCIGRRSIEKVRRNEEDAAVKAASYNHLGYDKPQPTTGAFYLKEWFLKQGFSCGTLFDFAGIFE